MDDAVDDLLYGGRAGDVDEIRAGLSAGAPVDARDANGTTALMMAAANGHLEAMHVLLSAGADVNAINERKNTALHWAVFNGQEQAIKALLIDGVDLMLKNEHGRTAAMDAELAGKGELVVLLLSALNDEDAAAAALGHGEEDEAAAAAAERVAPQPGVDQMLASVGQLAQMQGTDADGEAALPDTRGVLTGDLGGSVQLDGAATARTPGGNASFLRAAQQRALDAAAVKVAAAPSAPAAALLGRERPMEQPEIARLVADSAAKRTGDWRYSVLPGVVPRGKIQQLSADFFRSTELLHAEGNTFGPEFEAQYAGHRNYFYYANRNRPVDGAERAHAVFEELDAYTRQVVELHHPGVAVRLERAFGAYYEGGRDGFHRGVNEHCDGDANLVSTVVHAVLPDGDVGFAGGGELTISEVDGLPAAPISHSNETVGSVVYLGGSVFHHASPINMGGRRLVFCMFYACQQGDLSKHALR